MSLTGKTKASTYKDLLQMNNSNNGVDTTTRNVVDGEGTASAISLADDHLLVRPTNDSTSTFMVKSKDNENLLAVDSTNNVVKAGLGQYYTNTQFKSFGLWEFTPSVGEHHSLISAPMFQGASSTDFTGEVNGGAWGGTGTNPVTSLTLASAGMELVPSLWLLQENITIQEINYIITSSAVSSVGIQVMAYSIVAGSIATSGDLSGGVVVAQTGSTPASITPIVTGDDRISSGTLTLTKPNRTKDEAIILFAEASDTDTFTIQTTIKYHLR